MPKWGNQFATQIRRVQGWFVDGESARSKALLSEYYQRPFRGATFDELAGLGNEYMIEPRDLDAIRALSIHPSRQFVSLLDDQEFQAAVAGTLRQIGMDLLLEELPQRDFDKLLEPESPGWDLWEILAANLRASEDRGNTTWARASWLQPNALP